MKIKPKLRNFHFYFFKAILVLFTIIMLPSFVFAWADWNSISNSHFRIYYKDNWNAEAEKALRTLEHYRPQLEKLTGNSKGRIPFTIEDMGAMSNGYTDPVGTRISLFAYQPTKDELACGEDWWQMVACHEYAHELQMTRASGTPELLRLLFGNIFYPNLWQPAWMTEGITVFAESQLSPYSGRLNGGTYPSVITALAKTKNLPSPTKASYASFDTPQASYYTFGGSFYSYLTKTYGTEKLSQLFGLTSASTWSYSEMLLPNLYLDKCYRAVFGKSTSALWEDWKADASSQTYTLPQHRITTDGWFKSDLKIDRSFLYYLSESGVKTGPSSGFSSYRLSRINLAQNTSRSSDKGLSPEPKPEILIEQNTDFAAGYAIKGNTLYYTRTEWQKGFANSEADGWGSVVELWQKDMVKGKKSKLYSGQLRAFCPLADGSILLSTDNETHTKSALTKLAADGKSTSVIYQADGLIFAIIPYGSKYVLGYKPAWHNNSAYLFDPGSRSLTPILQTQYIINPVSLKGDELIFNAVFDGKTGGYVINLQTNAISRLSTCSDVRSPAIAKDGRLYFISLNEAGYDVYKESLVKSPYQLIAPRSLSSAPVLSSSKSAANVVINGHRSSYWKNVQHLLVPRMIHLPIITSNQDTLTIEATQHADYQIGALLAGKDAVGDFPAWQTMIIYNTADSLHFPHNFSYDFSLANYFFHPVKQTLSYSYEYEEKNEFSAQQYLTFLRRQNYGLTDLTGGFTYSYDGYKERKIWTPFLRLSFDWANGSLVSSHFMPYETKAFLPSDRERLGWQSVSQLHQKLPFSSELKGLAYVADDKKADKDEVFGNLRCYDKDFNVNSGAMLQTSIYRPIFRIREGLWVPQIYVEDIDLGLFYDWAQPFTDEDYKQHSFGAEVLTELGLAFNYRLDLGVRFGYNQEKKAGKAEFILGALF
ncbi:MAG TPA: hypothetical protein PLF50_06525 [Candidatus Cloacimonadota bacterium]|nr:hypothetical protein [Candidatus Cloacimonadota bacterium]HOV17126.1 hypothetical protein [Candidatus Cloacimonadota bacterium]HQL15420.1 hypothetical protein [Candidatus Cloacimonadota bacterium]